MTEHVEFVKTMAMVCAVCMCTVEVFFYSGVVCTAGDTVPRIHEIPIHKLRGGHPDRGPGCMQQLWLVERGGSSPLLNAFRLHLKSADP